MSSSACPICFEIYTEGNRCPKLLPCTHTVCVLCLRQLVRNSQVQCPECRLHHPVPSGSVQAFPTNRYVLENIELAQRNAALEGKEFDAPTNEPTEVLSPSAPPDDTASEFNIQPGTCDMHNEPFIVFCFEEQCNKMLCHTCFIALGHQNHDVVYFEEQEALRNSIRNENNQQRYTGRGDHPDDHFRQEIALSPAALGISQDNSRWPRRNRNKNHRSTRRCHCGPCCIRLAVLFVFLFIAVMTALFIYIFALR